MGKTDQKVSVGELLSATVRYNSYDDATRVYSIVADESLI